MSLGRGFRSGVATLTLVTGLLGQPTHALAQPAPARQITLFGVLASPVDLTIDPELKPIEAQLRKLLPNHGFKLLGVKNKRLAVGDVLECKFGDSGFEAAVQAVDLLDSEGKVQLRFNLEYQESTELGTLVRTPPNQLFFCDKALPDRHRLLIGIGAR